MSRKTGEAVKRPLLLVSVFGALLGTAATLLGPGPAAAEISPTLDGLPVDGFEYRVVRANYDRATNELSAVKTHLAASATELAELQLADTRLTNELQQQTDRKKKATVTLVAARASLRSLAVDSYVHGQPDADAGLDVEVATRLLSNRTLTQAISEEQAVRLEASAKDLDEAVREMTADLLARMTGRQRMTVVQAEQQQAAADELRLTEELGRRQAELEQARVTANVVGQDFALVALDAYWRAALAVAGDQPECGIPWWALAGITRSESRHGTYGGARLLANGDVNRPIIGIPLDGNNNTAVIGDTDGGAYDGDTVYDRAVGPMQFIPSTWRSWARDGNADGRRDPNNIYDAALAAANYLCASGPMQTDEDMRRGFFSYNHSESYVTTVLNYAKGYARFRIPTA